MQTTKTRRRWYNFIGGSTVATVGTIVATAGVALAAALFFVNGSFSADAAQPTLIINPGAHLNGTLVPGSTVGATVSVGNPNDFPVKVTRVLVKTNSLVVTPSDCDGLALGGTPGSHLNNEDGNLFTLSPAVSIPAGANVDVVVPQVVSQAGTATKFCGVKANYVLEASVGN